MSYYTRIGEHTYRPTEHAGGAWNPTEIHFSALGGLILHEIDLHRGDRRLSLGRVSFDGLTVESIGQHADVFEKAVRKVRGRVMPPPNARQPGSQASDALVGLARATDRVRAMASGCSRRPFSAPGGQA